VLRINGGLRSCFLKPNMGWMSPASSSNEAKPIRPVCQIQLRLHPRPPQGPGNEGEVRLEFKDSQSAVQIRPEAPDAEYRSCYGLLCSSNLARSPVSIRSDPLGSLRKWRGQRQFRE